jgi:phasin family protein
MANQANPAINEQQLEAALRIARITLDGAEKLLQLQLDTIKQTLEETAQQTAQLTAAKDIPAALAVRSQHAQQTATTLLAFARDVYELSAQTQTELVRQTTGSVGTSPNVWMDQFQQFIPAGSRVPDLFNTNALKSSFAAAQAAYDSMTKAAKQVTEFADTSLKAATTATAAAIKPGAKR